MLLIALSIVATTVPTFANSSDTMCSIDVTTAFTKKTQVRLKDSNSGCYLNIQTAPTTYSYVQAQGCVGGNTNSTRVNQTYVLGKTGIPLYVTCRVNVNYNIHNLIYENGYKYAALDFQTTQPGRLVYVWSPDIASGGSLYTNAT